MGQLVNESARLLSNEQVGPRLHLMQLESPVIAQSIKPGQFIHMKVPGHQEHVLRRPFSVYAADAGTGTLDVLYQEVGSITQIITRVHSSLSVRLATRGQPISSMHSSLGEALELLLCSC